MVDKSKCMHSNKSVEEQAESCNNVSNTNKERRKAVRNLIAGSGLTVGAATAGSWVTPVVNAVITPAHAQTSTAMVLSGNAALSPTTPKVVVANTSTSILDFLVPSAHAGIAAVAPNLGGACIIVTFTSDTSFNVSVETIASPAMVFTGTASGSVLSASGAGITFNATVDFNTTPATAVGTLVTGGDTYNFTIDSSTASCSPMAPAPPIVNETFNTPGPATFTVPAGLTSLQVSISGGGGGGGGAAAGNGGQGGEGELITTNLTVTSGQVLSIVVGAGGIGGAGFNGSGGSGGTGGGLSSIETIIASGGGGAGGEGPPGSASPGSAGEGPNGGAAGAATVGTNSAGNGGAAGAGGGSAGGVGGLGCCFPGAGNPGQNGEDGFVILTTPTAT